MNLEEQYSFNKNQKDELLGVRLGRCKSKQTCEAEASRLLDRYTGADITAVVREAGLAALTEDLQSQKVAKRHFNEALKVLASVTLGYPSLKGKIEKPPAFCMTIFSSPIIQTQSEGACRECCKPGGALRLDIPWD